MARDLLRRQQDQDVQAGFSGSFPASRVPVLGPVDETSEAVRGPRYDVELFAAQEWTADLTPGDPIQFSDTVVDSGLVEKDQGEFEAEHGTILTVTAVVNLGVDPTASGVQGELWYEYQDPGGSWVPLEGIGYYS